MCSERVIVLKFGGSVLRDAERLRLAVHEVYRWRREGWRVVAVVSALEGRTDALLRSCADLADKEPGYSVAAMLACGERESAARLGLLLDGAGVPAAVLDPGAVALRAQGPALDATPTSLDVRALNDALDRDGVVVFPGFIALDAHARTVTLGRGGSDLTALYLAHALGADNCRLVKDVDGLYERDPGAPGPRALRYAQATYADALATDGSIVQHKAVRFARDHAVRFELGRLNATRPTRIGAGASRLSDERDEPVRLSVALLGLGVVGGGVAELIAQLPELFDLRGALVRRPSQHQKASASGLPITDDPGVLLDDSVDVAVEAIGGVEPAAALVAAALSRGTSVVTANKALLAAHAETLGALAEASGVTLLGSASVGGGAPVLERIAADAPRVTRLRGVLNGTTNFVLERLRDGHDFDEAVNLARRAGLAEADPSRDLDGRDALDKLCVIARAIGAQAPRDGLSRDAEIDAGAIGTGAHRVRQVATVARNGSGGVRLEQIEPGDPLFALPDEWNAAAIEFEDGRVEVVRGRGAGRWPTAESVLGDLLELSRRACDAIAPVNADTREVAHA